jgi:hypothetical protein
METAAIPDYPRGITFEQVWAGFMEDRERQKEINLQIEKDRKEADRQREKDREEADRQREKDREDLEKTREMIKELSRQMGHLENRFGELAEHLVAPGIAQRFNELGFQFDSMAPGGEKLFDEKGKVKAQVDLVLRNGEYIIAVEVKTKPKADDVEEHIERLAILRDHWSKKGDTRKLRGAIAGAIFSQDAKIAALKAGLYVIVQSGDTMKLELSDGFVPREW